MDVFGINRRKQRVVEIESILQAMDRSQATIEFSLDGHIVAANQNFLAVMGYQLSEIVGQHHSIFVTPEEREKEQYRAFWDRLRRGEFQSAEFKRVAKDGREVWIQATYNPIMDLAGKPIKVIKFATDITRQKQISVDAAGQLAAISESQAVIEFDTRGNILSANENFCLALGYNLDEFIGRHHRMFVTPEEGESAAYHDFWNELSRGKFKAGEFLRIGKGGRQVWIQATYNPIVDVNGKVYKVVKFATYVTARKRAIEVLGKSLAGLAAGDLTHTITDPFEGDLDQIRVALNQSIDKFSQIVGQLRLTSRSLKTATGEILVGANDLAVRTTKQAATLEETSSAMEQLAATVVDNAKRAETASQVAISVARTAQESGQVMVQADAAMQRISSSSARISNVIEMIDDIAFQTNLLALNASVEAARAGDAGKGFAVVAVEVRRLAQSAASASLEVKQLIEQSADEVRGGSRLVSDAASKISQMMAGVDDNAKLIDDIARASKDQSTAIHGVSNAVRQIDEITQHNAALVEQTNAAIEQTEGQAKELDRIIDTLVIEKVAPSAETFHRSGTSQDVRIKSRARSSATYPVSGSTALAERWQEA
jgi:methyl-accepting chemotaxis protein